MLKPTSVKPDLQTFDRKLDYFLCLVVTLSIETIDKVFINLVMVN